MFVIPVTQEAETGSEVEWEDYSSTPAWGRKFVGVHLN
jgi:hypothetical protein